MPYSVEVPLEASIPLNQRTLKRTPGNSFALQRFSPEFRLVLACLRFPLTSERLTDVRKAATHVHDWQHFLAIGRRHRVLGLLDRACTQAGVPMPADAAGALRSAAASQARQSLLQAMESVRINKQLRAAGIVPIFLKGETLTMLAYGQTGLRQAKDVDLLVPADQMERAVDTLRAAGYQPLPPADALTAAQQKLWKIHGKSMDWINFKTGIELELHWKLSDLPLLAPEAAAYQQASLGPGSSLTTLDRDHLFAYLCVHGASHGWSRLKWLADVFALLPQGDATACEALYQRVALLGARRPAAQALLLCHDLFGFPLDASFRQELESDRLLGMLRASVLRLLARGNETEEIFELPFGTSSVYLLQLMLHERPSVLWSHMKAHLYPVKDVIRWRGPSGLMFLFPVSRAFSWIRQRLQHSGRSRPVD